MELIDAQKLVLRTTLSSAVHAAKQAEEKVAEALKQAREYGFTYTTYSLEDRSYGIRRLASDLQQNLEEFETADPSCL